MPLSTLLTVIGSWLGLAALTLIHFFVWSKKDRGEEE